MFPYAIPSSHDTTSNLAVHHDLSLVVLPSFSCKPKQVLAWKAVFVRHFGEPNAQGELKLPPTSLSIVTSMINVGELIGSLAAIPLNDPIERKYVFVSGSIAVIVGVVLQLATTSSTAFVTVG